MEHMRSLKCIYASARESYIATCSDMGGLPGSNRMSLDRERQPAHVALRKKLANWKWNRARKLLATRHRGRAAGVAAWFGWKFWEPNSATATSR